MLSHFSLVWLIATLWIVALQAPQSMGFPRQEYWSGLSCPPPGDLLDPGIEPTSPVSPALQVDSLPLSHWGSLSLFPQGWSKETTWVVSWDLGLPDSATYGLSSPQKHVTETWLQYGNKAEVLKSSQQADTLFGCQWSAAVHPTREASLPVKPVLGGPALAVEGGEHLGWGP